MTYLEETMGYHLQFNRELNQILFEQMEFESNYIIACLESMEILSEATDVKTGEKKENIFKRFIEFIKNIFSKFKEKIALLTKGNKEWLNQYASVLDKINYDGLEIEMVPFWNMNLSKQLSIFKDIDNDVSGLARLKGDVIERYSDRGELEKSVFKEYLDRNSELPQGLKNVFRTGDAQTEAKAVKLSGNELKSKVTNEFRPYCLKYGTEVSTAINNSINDIEKNLNMIERELSKRPVNEGFLLIENAFFGETELAFLDASVLTEAEEPAEKKEDNKPEEKPKTGDKDKPQSVTKVTISDHGDGDTLSKKKALENTDTGRLKVIRNGAQIEQVAITALMTVCEEKYNAYMNVMKQIISARGKKAKEDEGKVKK